MRKTNDNRTSKAILIAICFLVAAGGMTARPAPANAQLGGAIGGALGGCGSALTSAIGGLFGKSGGSSSGGGILGNSAVPVHDDTVAANTTAVKNVTCTWRGVAWQLAHMVLHSLTSDVVKWINTGFQGSPAFLTNPQAYFLDLGDQATGAFIADSGPLRNLCTPFSADIKLALALEQSQSNSYTARYTCTLSTVINNVQNVGNNITVNGQNIKSFTDGNFSQGGWSSFVTMTSAPQNNPFGAYLQASSDIHGIIGTRQSGLSADLSNGGGFMSWPDCTDVTAQVNNGKLTSDGNSSLTSGVDSKGKLTYKRCTIQTPGSVINASLNKQLGATTDELNMTNDINQVVSALFSQLMKQVLTGGLQNSTQPGSGTNGSSSYVDQLANDPQYNQNFADLKQQALDQLAQEIGPVQQAASYRGQALLLVKTQQSAYAAVRACIANDITQAGPNASQTSYLQSQLTALDGTTATLITPVVATYQAAAETASSTIIQIQNLQAKVDLITSAQALTNLDVSTELSMLSSSAGNLASAQSDFNAATTLVKSLSQALAPYQSVCNGTASFTPTTY